MTNASCRNCDRAADTGACCRSFAAGIAARALNPFCGSRRKELRGRSCRRHRFHPPSSVCPANPALALPGVTINEEESPLLDLRPHRERLTPQGARLLLGQVPGPASPSQGLPAAESFEIIEQLTRRSPGNGVDSVSANFAQMTVQKVGVQLDAWTPTVTSGITAALRTGPSAP